MHVSPERVANPLSSELRSVVGIALADGQTARLGPVVLVRGMPVDAFLHTGDGTLLAYSAKPLRADVELDRCRGLSGDIE